MEATNKSTKFAQKIPNLPQEIITEIFLRLPVKSLLKFKSVCKQWLISISSSQFIKTHLDFSRKSKNHTLILETHNDPSTFYTCSVSSLLCNNVIDNSRVLDFPIRDPDFDLVFLGSCNGLLFVSVNSTTSELDPSKLVLYNPATRKSKTLPFSGTKKGVDSFGFCYDELLDDFKVVELDTVGDYGDNVAVSYRTSVKVYSLRDDAWTRIVDDYDGYIHSSDGPCVGGVLHWRIKTNDGYLIFRVNAVTYSCDTLVPPPDDGNCRHWSLGEFNGCLCIFQDYYEVRLDVWVMKEYGVVESWSKVVSIAYPANPRNHLSPLFVLEDGEIFLEYYRDLIIYNCRSNSSTVLENHSIGLGGLCSVAVPAYIESLVDPSSVRE